MPGELGRDVEEGAQRELAVDQARMWEREALGRDPDGRTVCVEREEQIEVDGARPQRSRRMRPSADSMARQTSRSACGSSAVVTRTAPFR